MTVSAYADIVPFSMYRPANDVERVVKADVLPVSFDLRNNYVIPPVRHQYFWGTCWAFAVMASNESNYLMQVAAGPSNDFLNVKYAESMDLSEMHLAWYTFMSPERRQNFSVVNRKTRMLERNPSAYQVLNNGGWNVEAAAVLARGWGWGPIQEKDGLKYSDFTDVDNIETLAKNIAKSPDVYPSSLRLIEASFMVTRFDSDGNLLFSTEANRNRVKNMVMTKGGIAR